MLAIITVCYNAEKHISRLLHSIDCQTNSNFLHLIIDGASSDNTLKYVEKFGYLTFNPDKLTNGRYYVSEKDHGIYDAMNKGLDLIGERNVVFINADDYLSSPNSVQIIQEKIEMNRNTVHTFSIRYQKEEKLYIAQPVKVRWEDLVWDESLRRCPHVTTVFPPSLQRYDLNYKLASDYDFTIRLVRKFGVKTHKNPITVMVRSDAQLSNLHRKTARLESSSISESHKYHRQSVGMYFRLIHWYVINSVLRFKSLVL